MPQAVCAAGRLCRRPSVPQAVCAAGSTRRLAVGAALHARHHMRIEHIGEA